MALKVHMARGELSGRFWIRDAFLVALGLRMMRRVSELAAL